MEIIHNKFEKIVVSDSALPLVSNCILEEENAIHEWKMMSIGYATGTLNHSGLWRGTGFGRYYRVIQLILNPQPQ